MTLLLEPGQRGLLVGKTGSGKTQGALFMLRHMPTPVVILDTKIEPSFETAFAPGSWSMQDGLWTQADARSVHIVRPTPAESVDWMQIDAWLGTFMERGPITIYIDELYQVHGTGGRAGPGLVGLLTRGRSKGVTLLMSTQRPAWISRFCLTESEKYYVYRLNDPKDRQRLADVTSRDMLRAPRRFHFWFYQSGRARAELFAPVPARIYRGV